jgi:hypothetical protein
MLIFLKLNVNISIRNVLKKICWIKPSFLIAHGDLPAWDSDLKRRFVSPIAHP